MTWMEPTSNTITLSDGYMRDLLLAELCRRIDIVEYFRSSRRLEFTLEHVEQDDYLSDCPLCLESGTFQLNRRTGKCYCRHCKRENDLLSLIGEEHGYDLEEVLAHLTGYLQCKNARQVRLLKGGVA